MVMYSMYSMYSCFGLLGKNILLFADSKNE